MKKPFICCQDLGDLLQLERFHPIFHEDDETLWLGSGEGNTFSAIIMSFCPFCGMKLERSETIASVIGKLETKTDQQNQSNGVH